MKETIEQIPLMDAFRAQDECPLCFLERKAEQHAIHFLLGPGASYMEEDIREETDRTGFCRIHFKKMYDYGNKIGNALILHTHLRKINRDMQKEMENFQPAGKGKNIFQKRKKGGIEATSIGEWIGKNEDSCYVCEHFKGIYHRYLQTFFHLYKKDESFRTLFEQSNGFCLPHFRDLTEMAQEKLKDKEKTVFYSALFDIMKTNMQRLEEEVSWLIDKYDYRNKDADWGNSRDSVQRAMQKLAGGYPADPIFNENERKMP